MKKAFSLIEVIFVLVILGIVASISSQIIIQVYESYILQNALYRTTTKTELVANQIVNRLTYTIPGTTIAKEPNKIYTPSSMGTNWIMLEDIDASLHQNLIALEWIGYDNDSFSAGATPYWSGVANYETATSNSFITPASQLSEVNKTISNLSNKKINLDISSNNPAVLFMNSDNYDVQCMGLINKNDTSCIFPIAKTLGTEDNLTFTGDHPTIVTERYKLAWSAYALVPIDEAPIGDGLYNLYLYYNYQPWNHETYKNNGTKKLLLTNISVFKFTENGGVIQLKLCATENIGADYNISSCKEKAIIK